jgi:hypothetical protein
MWKKPARHSHRMDDRRIRRGRVAGVERCLPEAGRLLGGLHDGGIYRNGNLMLMEKNNREPSE